MFFPTFYAYIFLVSFFCYAQKKSINPHSEKIQKLSDYPEPKTYPLDKIDTTFNWLSPLHTSSNYFTHFGIEDGLPINGASDLFFDDQKLILVYSFLQQRQT